MRRDAQPPGGGRNAILLALLLTAVAAAGCSRPPPAPMPVPEPRAAPAPAAPSCPEGAGYDEAGTASWYGEPHHGRPTASGEPFDMNGLSAAHRSLPLGTRIRVTNADNGRSVVLTVNDRGPYVDGRLLDVSHAAARELGFGESGLAPVRIKTVPTC